MEKLNDRTAVEGKRQLLIELLAKHKKKSKQKATIIKRASDDRQSSSPSFAQQRLWLLDKIDGGSTHYNMPGALRLTGALDLEALTRAINTIIARHESLRTCFVEGEGGEPIQVIQPVSSVDVPVIDISSLPESERETALSTLLSQEASTPFDLSTDRMLRAQVVKVDSQSHVLLVTMHHIASDGWSMGILVNEFSALYQAYVQGEENPLAPLAIQYADYAHWQREWLQGEVLDAQMGYWQEQLSDLPVVHSLPLDKVRPKEQTFNGAVYHSVIESSIQDTLNNLCHEVGGTLFMGLHAAFSVLLSRYSNETDIVVGSPIANREQAEVEALIGFFVNTLVLRSDLSGNPSFHDLLKQSKATLLNAYAHQQVPFEQLVEVLQPERSTAHSPLFQVMLVLQNNEEGTLELPGLTLSPVEQSGGGVAQCDLTLNVTETVDGLQLGWEYNTDLFTEGTITRLASHFDLLLTGMVNHPDDNVFCIDMLSAEERHQQLVEWNDTTADFPRDRCIHQLFEQQVAETPDAIAVVFGEQSLSYSQFDHQATCWSAYLQERGVKPGTVVGIYLERSLCLSVAIWSVLKSGGCFVLLDPSYPASRLEYLLEDSGAQLVLSDTVVSAIALAPGVASVLMDEVDVSGFDDSGLKVELSSTAAACIFYTSGSTGKPKGSVYTHRNVVNYSLSMIEKLECTEADRVLQMASVGFDVVLEEVMPAWLCGACVVFDDSHGLMGIPELQDLLASQSISCMEISFAQWREWLYWLQNNHTSPSEHLRVVMVGCDSIPSGLMQDWLAYDVRLLHVFGLTETTITSSVWDSRDWDGHLQGVMPIGQPIGNTQLYILDGYQRPQPVGVSGELYIGGAGVTEGYLNRPALTQQRFVPNPFSDVPGDVLYRTGDLARYLPDGNVVFIGRGDEQVKIRGFRIELGEIEYQLLSQDTVNDAVVVALGDDDDKRLVAYVTHNDALSMLIPEGEAGYEGAHTLRHAFIDSLKSTLGHALPDYMVPSAFVVLEQLPLTPNGKIDRKALPAPDMALQQDVYVAPTTDTEKRLCEIWQEVLGLEQVGVTDNFFALGGHSLLATKLMANIHNQLGVDVPLRVLFNCPTIATFSAALSECSIEASRPVIVSVSREHDLSLSFAQQRLWLLDKIDGGNAHYNIPGALCLTGVLDLEALTRAINTIFARHESLRTCFVEGEGGEPIQVIQPVSSVDVPVIDISSLPESERETALSTLLSQEASTPFDLSTDRMLRAQVVKVDSQSHVLLVTMHHIASDGWSMGILVNEFSALYQAYVQGEENPLAPLAIQYADYAHWQREWLQGEVLDAQMGYWQEQLSDLPVVHSLPLDKVRPKEQTFNGAVYHSVIESSIQDTLNNLCHEVGGTLFMGLHAAFSVLLSRYSNETDIVVGSSIANREQAEVEALIGFFLNSLVLRSDLSGNPSFHDLLKQSKATLLNAYAHQQVPFEQLVEVLQPERSTAHSPLFQVMLDLQNNEEGTLELPDLTLSPVEQSDDIAKYDLTLSITETVDGLQLGWEYNTDLFTEGTITRLASHFDLLLTGMVNHPDDNVFCIDMLSAEERHQQLVEWNDTTADFPRDRCIHQLFEQQVAETPDAIAVVFEDKQLTYGELNAKANQLAHYLIEERGVVPDTLVGICVERSIEMIVGILGILKAGGAYVPLDPSYPEARLEYMLDDADLTTVLLQARLAGQTPVSDSQALYLDSEAMLGQLSEQPTTNPVVSSLTSNHLAYVIYTSGSTGNPKGVMVEHKSANNYLLFSIEHYCRNAKGSIVSTSLNFDATLTSLFSSLVCGKYVRLIQSGVMELDALISLVFQASEPLLFKVTPAHLDAIAGSMKDAFDNGLEHTYVVGGEKLKLQTLEYWKEVLFPKAIFFNEFGPTESTVGCCVHRVASNNTISSIVNSVPIGRAIDNTQLHILNNDELAPVGVIGELHIGGLGLARGYLNQPGLTDEKFIANPFYDARNPSSSERLYKTGDLVRYLPDGNIEFLGRIDHQVKVRGFRIELGEIEYQLLSQDTVNDAVVVALGDDDDKRLVAYVTHDDAALMLEGGDKAQTLRHAFIDSLKSTLGHALPDYMVPSAFVVLEQLPLTPNGKIDRKALPAPDMALQQDVYVAPTTDTEKRLCEIWQEVLGLEQVGVTDNFFALGGHSLLAINVIAKAQNMGLPIVVEDFFAAPQLSALAQVLDSHNDTALPVFATPENVIPANCQQITPQMLPLVSLTQREITHIASQVSGGMENIQDIYPLGPLQEGILFTHMTSAKSDPYVSSVLFEVKDESVISEFIAALEFVINRHDVLRTAVFWKGLSVPVQVVCKETQLPVTWLDLEVGEDAEQHMLALTLLEDQWLNLTQAPLLRLCIAKGDNEGQHFLLLQFHHIIDDATSLKILQAEVEIFMAGDNAQLEALVPTVPYRNFIAHALHQAQTYDAQGYFTDLLGDVSESTAPFDLLDVQGDGTQIVELREAVPAEVARDIRTLSKSLQVSPASLFHSAFGLVVGACSGRDDVVFGSVMSGRLQGVTGSEAMPGVFINTLPVRLKMNGSSVLDYVLSTHRHLRDSLPFEQAPLSLTQSCSGLENSTPLFSAMFNYRHSKESEGVETSEAHLNDTLMKIIGGQERTNYPFSMNVDDYGVSFGIDVQVDNSINIARVMSYMQTALGQLVECLTYRPEAPVNQLSVLPDSERHQQVVEWNDTTADFPRDMCIHQLFEQQVAETPDAIAVVFEDEQLTYGELNARANQLAHYLIEVKGVTPDTLVGICVERSIEMIVGILGILKAGGAYVPLDPSYPEARLEYMLDDADLTTVLLQARLAGQTPVSDSQALYLDSEAMLGQLSEQPTTNPVVSGLISNHLAYVIYTSGSTGNPKGVMVEHKSLVSFTSNMMYTFTLEAKDSWLAVTSLSFDIHTLELYLPLISGSRLVVATTSDTTSPDKLSSLISKHKISILQATPSTWKMLVDNHWEVNHAIKMLCGGEALSSDLKNKLVQYDHGELWNMYGPTETCVWSLMTRIEHSEPVVIGKPIGNTQCYVINKAGQLLPIGAVGELHIAGLGLARGYLNQPGLTDEKFIANPFYDARNPSSSERLYKTGDLVRYLPDGNIEFLGRIDHQVKVRGFRIELGEIEYQLLSQDTVNDAVVVALGDDDDKRLVAYVTHDDAALMLEDGDKAQTLRHAFIDRLKSTLGHALPDYMVPSAFVVLEQLPLTPNGKIDRKALPTPDMALQQKAYVAPTTDTEKRLCEIWQEVLGLEQVGVTDNFFELGGHSLLATRLITAVNTRLEIDAPLRLLFSAPSIADFSLALTAVAPGVVRPLMLPVSREHDLSLSFAQQRLWLLDKIDGGSTHYNMPGALRLTGALDLEALTRAINTIIARHESLRTCFVEGEGGEPIQVIQPVSSVDVPVIDISSLPESERETALSTLLSQEASTPFDLSTDRMLRAQVVKVDSQSHVLLVTMHHIASDGWSMGILVNEFSALYQAYVQGEENPLAPLAIQYADYAHWQREWLQGEVLDAQMGYWQEQLSDLPVVHSLPLDKVRPKEQTFNGAVYHSVIESSIQDMLNNLCHEVGGTLFMGLHAAFSVLLSRYSNETDIVVGSPIANREQAEVEALIGFFVNTLVLRSDLSGNPSFHDLLKQSKATLLNAYAHQQVPFEQLVEVLQPERSTAHSPLFQVMLALQNNEEGTLELPGLTLSPVEQSGGGVAQCDLTLNVTETVDGLQLGWEYNTDLFTEGTITRLASHFDLLLTGMVNHPDDNVFCIDMLSAEEEHHLITELNDTAMYYPKDKCIHELFEQQARENPDNIAVVFEDEQLTYRELNSRANQLAHYLVETQGVTPDTLVGLCVERSLEMVVGILGILKAGGAYVPLDPTYPKERLAYMMDDASLTSIVSHTQAKEVLNGYSGQVIDLDSTACYENYITDNLDKTALGLTSSHLAYVIYTSGSTGKPKGVMVEHQGVINMVLNQIDYFDVKDCSRVLQFASISFDAAVSEWLMALGCGASLWVLAGVKQKKPESLIDYILNNQITHATIPPAVLAATPYRDDLYLQSLIVAGEPCKESVAELWRKDYRFFNAYGPSENSVCTAIGEIDSNKLHIGRCLPNTGALLFNNAQSLSPLGSNGELYIRGDGLARGYLNRPELTAERFIDNPYYDSSSPNSSKRLYRTGDLVRYLPDGNLEFIGRVDDQVKIRGFRIELGEVEFQLARQDGVNSALVMAKELAGSQQLVGYIKPSTELESDMQGAFISELKVNVSRHLPDYMIPSVLMVVEEWPLTPNGKVDRKALPAPDGSSLQGEYVAPQTETEHKLVAIWAELLNIDADKISTTANFFELGGHSLLTTRLAANIRVEFDIELPIVSIFDVKNIQFLSEIIVEYMTFVSSEGEFDEDDFEDFSL